MPRKTSAGDSDSGPAHNPYMPRSSTPGAASPERDRVKEVSPLPHRLSPHLTPAHHASSSSPSALPSSSTSASPSSYSSHHGSSLGTASDAHFSSPAPQSMYPSPV